MVKEGRSRYAEHCEAIAGIDPHELADDICEPLEGMGISENDRWLIFASD